MLKYICVAILAYYCHHLYTNFSQNDVIILLKANNKVDIQSIKLLSNTRHVFEVKPFHTKKAETWNYLVFGKGFLSDEARVLYAQALKSFKFVDESVVYDLHGEAPSVIFINLLMKATGIFGKPFGFLLSRPLPKADDIPPICNTIQTDIDQPMVGFTFMRVRNSTALMEYVKAMKLFIFPSLNINLVYAGSVRSKDWPLFNMLSYENKLAFCELVESKVIAEYSELYMESFADLHTYTGKEV